MIGTDVIVAAPALALAVAAGLAAHEWAHAVALRLFGVDHSVTYFPGETGGVLARLACCPWAAVQPHPTGRDSANSLRIAALAPVLLALPVFALGIGGALPIGSPVAMAVAVGWLACAIPSPQDFSVVFYAHRALEIETAPEPNAAAPVSRAD